MPTVFYVLLYLFLAVCGVNMVAIFFACLPLSRPFKVLFGVAAFFAAFWIIVPIIMFTTRIVFFGAGTMVSGRAPWLNTLSQLGLGALVAGLFYVLAVALITPPSVNRALPVRLYVTAIWLLAGLLDLVWIRVTGESELIMPWIVATLVLMAIALIVVISNSDQLSQRVRRTIPASPLKRIPAFLFFNGAAGGIVWSALMVGLTLAMGMLILVDGNDWLPKGTLHKSIVTVNGGEFVINCTAFMTYAFSYALTALFIQRTFFSRRPAKLTGLLAVLLAASLAIIPTFVLFILNQLSWKSLEGLQLGNAFNLFSSLREPREIWQHLVFSSVWLLVIILLNARWFFRQVQSFRPLNAAPAPPPVLDEIPNQV